MWMSKWTLTRVSEMADIISGGTPKTEIAEYWNGDIPWLSVKDFSGDSKRVYSSEKSITELGLNNSATQLLYPGDIIISARGTVGEVAQIGKTMAFNQSCYGLRAKEGYSANFLYYVLKYQVKYLKTVANGAVFDTIILKTFDKMKADIPELPVQEKIASILSHYDDLIEANNRRIELLEQTAQELYKEWFVRFRFPGHEATKFENGLPSEWERKRLCDMIAFNPTITAKGATSFRSIPMAALSTNNMVIDEAMITSTDTLSGSRSQNLDTLLARITPCLENGKTGFVFGLKEYEVAGGSTEFIVMRSKTLTPYFVYFLARSNTFREYAINSMNGADGRQRAKVDNLEKLWWLQPPQKLLEQFDSKVKGSFKLIHTLNHQNQNLAMQRDLLLPRLMSGKLEV